MEKKFKKFRARRMGQLWEETRRKAFKLENQNERKGREADRNQPHQTAKALIGPSHRPFSESATRKREWGEGSSKTG